MTASLQELRSRISEQNQAYPPLTQTELKAFEAQHRITLPAEYRECLLQVSNGADQAFSLGQIDSGYDFAEWHENDDLVGELSKPFPYTSAWNDLTGLPDDDFDNDDDIHRAAWEEARESFEDRYWGPLDGAVPIAHLGCAIRHWLVVTGSERGSIWEDNRASYLGLKPLLNSDGSRMNYREWLDFQTS
jgi:hypothetical protein